MTSKIRFFASAPNLIYNPSSWNKIPEQNHNSIKMAKLGAVFATVTQSFCNVLYIFYISVSFFLKLLLVLFLKNLDFRKNLVVVLDFFSVRVKVSPASESIAGALRGRHEPNVARFGRG